MFYLVDYFVVQSLVFTAIAFLEGLCIREIKPLMKKLERNLYNFLNIFYKNFFWKFRCILIWKKMHSFFMKLSFCLKCNSYNRARWWYQSLPRTIWRWDSINSCWLKNIMFSSLGKWQRFPYILWKCQYFLRFLKWSNFW